MPYGITQCYLPPGSGENPAFTPSRAVLWSASGEVTFGGGRAVLLTGPVLRSRGIKWSGI